MTDVLKKVRDTQASFVTYMTPEESRTYDLCVMVEVELVRLREALAAIKLAAYDNETDDCYLIARKALEGK